ncbi:MAG: aspartate/glutamate racemase family protein [Bacillota bacterium]
MKVAAIHATTMAIEPIEMAFREAGPEAKLLHFVDTGLVPMIQEHSKLTPAITRRFARLLESAEESGVGCIQLTCSAFNNVTAILQPLFASKLFRSDEAMLDEALKYERIGLISTMKETPPALISYMEEKRPGIQVKSLVNAQAFQLMLRGETAEHDRLVKDMIGPLEGTVDVIVLSQYSLAHLGNGVAVRVPVLTGPKAAANRCLAYLKNLS